MLEYLRIEYKSSALYAEFAKVGRGWLVFGQEGMKNYGYTLILMPWLRLSSVLKIGNISFVPYKQEQIPSEYRPYTNAISRILKSYCDIHGIPIAECVLVHRDRKHPCKHPSHASASRVNEAAQLLAFYALARNQYFTTLGNYTNSTAFQVFFQRFTPGSEWIALTIRRRDGETLSGGYKHGEVKFSIPIQCAHLEPCAVDVPLLKSVDGLLKKLNAKHRWLVQAVSLYNQAHTDSDTVLPEREIVLMTSACEQLFPNCWVAEDFALGVGKLLNSYGSVKVKRSSRASKLQLTKGRENREQLWFLHQKWAQELYHLRNDFTHGNDITRRTWGWSIFEHAVMASFVFPLLVKVILTQSSQYTLARADRIGLGVIDILLNKKNWARQAGRHYGETRWRETIREYEFKSSFRAAVELAWEKFRPSRSKRR